MPQMHGLMPGMHQPPAMMQGNQAGYQSTPGGMLGPGQPLQMSQTMAMAPGNMKHSIMNSASKDSNTISPKPEIT